MINRKEVRRICVKFWNVLRIEEWIEEFRSEYSVERKLVFSRGRTCLLCW